MNILCLELPRISNFQKSSSLQTYTWAHPYNFPYHLDCVYFWHLYLNPHLEEKRQNNLRLEWPFLHKNYLLPMRQYSGVAWLSSKSISGVSNHMDPEWSWQGTCVMLRLVVESGFDLPSFRFSLHGIMPTMLFTIYLFNNPSSLNLPFQDKVAMPWDVVTESF